MDTAAITPERLSSSVISVPPLARDANGAISRAENQKIARHLENGGVDILLYGGNAVLYHIAPSEYDDLLGTLSEIAADSSLVIPSVGPSYGLMMDQAAMLANFSFPTAMILPTRDVVTSAGVVEAVTRFVATVGKPAVLYIKHEGYIEVEDAAYLMKEGQLSWIKYAIVRDDTADDEYLKALCDAVGTDRIISGIGEQPAIIHLRDFGLAGFTSGCVCIAPSRSMEMLSLLKLGEIDSAEAIRETFKPLEDLRNGINPVRVLHAAVELAGIAKTGALLPLLSDINSEQQEAVGTAATALLDYERQLS